MNTIQREALAKQAKQLATQNPGQYQRTVSLYILLGYAYIGGIVLLAFAFIAMLALLIFNKAGLIAFFLIKMKLGIPLVLFIWFALSTLWSRPKPTPGMRITEDDAPKLFEVLRQISEHTQARMPDDVIITHEVNAGIRRYNRFWLFGERRELIIGGNLTLCLGKKQFVAVMAHEFAHFSAHLNSPDSRAHGAIYTWQQIVEQINSSEHMGAFVYRGFLNWWYPRLHAWAMAGARQNEYEADALAAQLVGPEAMAAALVNIHVLDQYITEVFYHRLMQKASHMDSPPANRTELINRYLKKIPQMVFEENLAQLLKQNTMFENTHPCTRERIAALGIDPSTIDPMIKRRASDSFFGGPDHAIFKALDKEWAENISEYWTQMGEYHSKKISERDELGAKVASGDATTDERLIHACLIRDTAGMDDARPLFSQAYNNDPEHPGACMMKGVQLLDDDDASGVPLVQYAIDRDQGDWSQVLGMWETLFDYARRVEDNALLAKVEKGWEAAHSQYEGFQHERSYVTADDEFIEHDLSPEQVEKLVTALRDLPEIAATWLVKKKVSIKPEQSAYMLFVKCHPGAGNIEEKLAPFHEQVSEFNNSIADASFVAFTFQPLEEFMPWKSLDDPAACLIHRNDRMSRRARLLSYWDLVRYGLKGATIGLVVGFMLFCCFIWLQSTYETALGSFILEPAGLLTIWAGVPILGAMAGIAWGFQKTRGKLFQF